MIRKPLGRRIRRAAAILGTTTLLPALLLALMVGAMGAGPDEPRASSVNDNWQVFEGHAFADSRAVPKGASLVACLGGCDEGYVSTPVVIGDDGRYSNLRVAPGQAPKGDLITFWLVNKDDRLEAVQSWIYEGDGQTRKLHLSFKELPVGFTRVSHMPATGVTTDLTVPSAAELGLVETNSFQSVATGWRYGNVPVLPGFAVVFGLLLAAGGVSLLIYRRRLTW